MLLVMSSLLHSRTSWTPIYRAVLAVKYRKADSRVVSTGRIGWISSSQDSSKKKLSKQLKDDAEAVIIGGGVLGTSIAYHLAKAGMKDVILLEKSELTAGSTWHSVGVTSHYNPVVNMKPLTHYSMSLYKQLGQETGQDVGFHMCGSIRICTTPERLEEAKYQMQRHGWMKAPQRLITTEEVARLHPLLYVDDVLGALYFPEDGYIDPYSLTQALAKGARMYGAEIYMPAPVTGLNFRSDGRWDVKTPHGTIRAKHVVNAAGFWGREIGRMVGIELSLGVVHHQFLVTGPIPEVASLKKELPFMRDLEGSTYTRQEKQGILFGPYESADKMKMEEGWWDCVPEGFGKELFESDVDNISDYIINSMKRTPVLANAEITSTVSGPITYAPDAIPLLGPDAKVPNMWLALGTGYGIGLAGGIGKYLSDWMIDGEPPFDLIECEPGRYGNWASREYVLAKCRETYGLNNQIMHPKLERWAGRPVRTNGIYKRLCERGAQMGQRAGWEQPNWFAHSGDEPGFKPSFRRTNWFEPVGRECDLVLSKVGIIDLTPYGKFEVKGRDAADFLDRVFANELPKVGCSNINHMLTPKGKVYAEMTVTCLASDRYLLVTRSNTEFHDLRWLLANQRKNNYDIVITNITDDVACLGIAGPRSRDVLSKMTSSNLSDERFPYLAYHNLELEGIPVQASRFSLTGELGWELFHMKEHTADLYEALLAAGEEHGIGDFGTYALNSLRLEKGFRLWGFEMNTSTTAVEADLMSFVKLDKGVEFIGREALLKLKRDDCERVLCFMTVDTTDVDPEGNETVWNGKKVVGFTSSGSYSYQLNKSICFAYLPPPLTDLGSRVEVEMLGSRYPGVVVKYPLFDAEPFA
ncbi:dimethylglycine dehydrogenase, mitochondrial-like [Pocillopora damicornis]|uniref:dimethylglycine dehydrogenase, mitochondrial-like n=1 Tax=Pocillopora damicornis TaxID=46731 RepID=UPI000F55466D|nr:dimethylglycine dehydrogenase, mitochondrial-like [Pocillopora damicornis]